MIIGHININLIRNKFEIIKNCIKCNVDILLTSETELDESFHIGQFQIDGFSSPYRRNRARNGGSILLYFKEDILSELVWFKSDNDIE